MVWLLLNYFHIIMQLINHGVSDELLRNMKEQAQEFFALPLQEKKRWAQKPGSLEGYGQVFVTSPKQKLEWNDMLFLRTLPPSIRNQNLWPQKPQKFRSLHYRYSITVTVLLLSSQITN